MPDPPQVQALLTGLQLLAADKLFIIGYLNIASQELTELRLIRHLSRASLFVIVQSKTEISIVLAAKKTLVRIKTAFDRLHRCFICVITVVCTFVVVLEWLWDPRFKSSAADVAENPQKARFHVNYSSGTASIRGTQLMSDRQYFWEVKMTSPVYGTDMVRLCCHGDTSIV